MQLEFWLLLFSLQQTDPKVIRVISLERKKHLLALEIVQTPKRVLFEREMIVRCCGNTRCHKATNFTSTSLKKKQQSTETSIFAIKISMKTSTTTEKASTATDSASKSETLPTNSVIFVSAPTSTTSSSTTIPASTTTTTPATTPPKRCNGTMDRTCRPKTTCTVDSNLVNQIQLSGQTPYGNMITTGNGKQYFMGVNETSLTYDSAASYCCQMGLKMAEFTTIDSWNNFMATFMTFPYTSWDFFGETADNGNGTDTWCISGALVPDGIIPSRFYNLSCGTKNLLVLLPGGNLTNIPPNNAIHRYFCEEQN